MSKTNEEKIQELNVKQDKAYKQRIKIHRLEDELSRERDRILGEIQDKLFENLSPATFYKLERGTTMNYSGLERALEWIQTNYGKKGLYPDMGPAICLNRKRPLKEQLGLLEFLPYKPFCKCGKIKENHFTICDVTNGSIWGWTIFEDGKVQHTGQKCEGEAQYKLNSPMELLEFIYGSRKSEFLLKKK